MFYFNNRNNYETDISSQELEKKVFNIVYDRWPRLVTKKEIAMDLNVPHSQVSKMLSDLISKRNVSLSLKWSLALISQ